MQQIANGGDVKALIFKAQLPGIAPHERPVTWKMLAGDGEHRRRAIDPHRPCRRRAVPNGELAKQASSAGSHVKQPLPGPNGRHVRRRGERAALERQLPVVDAARVSRRRRLLRRRRTGARRTLRSLVEHGVSAGHRTP